MDTQIVGESWLAGWLALCVIFLAYQQRIIKFASSFLQLRTPLTFPAFPFHFTSSSSETFFCFCLLLKVGTPLLLLRRPLSVVVVCAFFGAGAGKWIFSFCTWYCCRFCCLLPAAWEILLLFLLVFYFGRVKLFNALPFSLSRFPLPAFPVSAVLPFAFSVGMKVGNLISKSSSSTLPVLVVVVVYSRCRRRHRKYLINFSNFN